MARRSRIRERVRGKVHRTYGEEVAFLLSLVISSVLGLTLLALLVMQIVEVLPGGLSAVIVLSLSMSVFVIGKAVLERTLALPTVSRGSTPVIRSGGR
jgi:hypothetical protein